MPLRSAAIYQLRLVLAGISPMIWRRMLVSSETTIAQLHYYIQVSFDWSGEHLHRFRIHGKDYGIAYLGGISFDDDPHAVPLSRFRLHPRESFRYEYDFTANWRVDIRLEELLPQDQRVLPVCVGGRAAAPGEECAGALAYLQRLDRHRYELPFEDVGKIAKAIRNWLDAGGGRQALGDLEELREAVESVSEYQEFQRRRCNRREVKPQVASALGPGGGGMTFQIRIVAIADNGQEQVQDIMSLQRTELKMETLGLTLAEGKAILSEIQRVVVEAQTTHCVAAHRQCSDCGQQRHSKGHHDLPLRTVFGKVTVASPRLLHCDCQPHETKSFSPLAQVLPERTTPELLFLETKWASLMSYGLTTELLQEVLPMNSPLHASTIREHVCSVAERLENELGEEQWTFIEGCQRDWNQLPAPDGPFTVGIDGGYIRGRKKQGHFEVVAGKSLLAFRREAGEEEELSGKCFAFVQTYDEKPKRRLFEVLRSQGLTMNQQVEFLSDGGEDVRQVQLYLNPEAEHLLDWFHLTMRLTVLLQTAKGIPEKIGEGEEQYEVRPQVEKQLKSIKWYLWHGNTFQALNKLESLEMDLEAAAYESKDDNTRKLRKGVAELHTYVDRNQQFLPNYGERYRNGERIASGFVESAVNQVVSKRMVKHQQMQWTQRGAHLLLQIRTRVLNEEWEDTFRRWYPGFRPQTQRQPTRKAA